MQRAQATLALCNGRREDVEVFQALAAYYNNLPAWQKTALGIIGAALGGGVIGLVNTREEWRKRFGIYLYLGALLGVNYLWGIPGLIIGLGFLGGSAVMDVVSTLERAEARRRARLLRAIKGYVHARAYEEYNAACVGDPCREFMKINYGVEYAWLLIDRFDEDGYSAEDLDAMRIESLKRAAEREAKRIAERETAKPEERTLNREEQANE